MKLTINRLRFLKLLNTVNIAILPKSPTPAYLNFKIDMQEDKLLLLGSNGELTITSSCPIKEDGKYIITDYEVGTTLISAKFLLEIVRRLESDFVTIEIVDDVIARISDNKSEFKLNAVRAYEYPDLDLDIIGEKVNFTCEDLKKIVSQTAFAASTKEVRPVLTAINAKADGSTIEFVATDSYRLAKKTYYLKEVVHFNSNIPVKTLNEVSKIVEGGEVSLTISNTKAVFTYNETNIYSRLIAGDFPKTSGMFPSNYPYILQVNSNKFISAMERVSLLAIERENIVKLSVSNEKLEISSKSEQIGSANETIDDYKYTGDIFEISFNVNYVIDAIKAAQSEEVVLSFVGEMSAFKVSSPNDNSLVQIVTPVRSSY